MTELTDVERRIWTEFHESAYRDDFKLAVSIVKGHPRWSIICSYYAMHDVAKLYLGKIHGVKISGPETHRQTIEELKIALGQKQEKEKIIRLLEKAEDEMAGIEPDSVPYLLLTGKKERGKAQYYSERVSSKGIDYSKKVRWFIANIAKPFIKIMEGMIDAG